MVFLLTKQWLGVSYILDKNTLFTGILKYEHGYSIFQYHWEVGDIYSATFLWRLLGTEKKLN